MTYSKRLIIILVVIYCFYRLYKMLRKVQFQRLKGRIKRAQRDATPLPRLRNIPHFLTMKILACNAAQIANKIRNLEFSCEEVMTVYIKRAYTIGRQNRYNAEEAYLSAIETARNYDRKLQKGKKMNGLLLGVPISVKDHIAQKGACTSCGTTNGCDIPDMDNSLILDMLKSEGAIPFVRSNVPQALAWMETDNYIYGRCLNPWNSTRTTGGSSGGEGGLIASRSSPLGIATDSAGSIRVPSAFCGVYGLKPTHERMTLNGMYSPMAHRRSPFEHIKIATFGPMGRCVDDLVLFMRSVWKRELFIRDPTIPPLPFDVELYKSTQGRKLTFGYYIDDFHFECSPPVKRVMQETIQKLRDAGHKVVEFSLPEVSKLTEHTIVLLAGDNMKNLEDALQGEPAKWYFRPGMIARYFQLFKSLLLLFLRMYGETRIAKFLAFTGKQRAAKMMYAYEYIESYNEKLSTKWINSGIDLIICPTWPLPALKHKQSLELFIGNSYSGVYNILRFPTGIVPTSYVHQHECYYESEYNDIASRAAKRCMEGAAGLPITVQVVALPYRDEVLLGGMKIVEELCGIHRFAH
jgi:fatty acid amide hydrolase